MAGEFLDMMIVKTISPNNELQKSLYKNYIIYIVEFSIEIKVDRYFNLNYHY